VRQSGFEVVAAADGHEALRLCETHPESIDLLLTDVVMPGPGMSGQKLARQATHRCPEIAVLYISGCTDDADVHHGRLDPRARFLVKPFTMEELQRKFHEGREGREGREAGDDDSG
jgi:CheY-like chemotaxis protein